MRTSKIAERTTTGDVTTDDAWLRGVILTGGSDAATAVIRQGGSSGTVVLSIKAATATTQPVVVTDADCSNGIHVTLTGTAPTCTVVWG